MSLLSSAELSPPLLNLLSSAAARSPRRRPGAVISRLIHTDLNYLFPQPPLSAQGGAIHHQEDSHGRQNERQPFE